MTNPSAFDTRFSTSAVPLCISLIITFNTNDYFSLVLFTYILFAAEMNLIYRLFHSSWAKLTDVMISTPVITKLNRRIKYIIASQKSLEKTLIIKLEHLIMSYATMIYFSRYSPSHNDFSINKEIFFKKIAALPISRAMNQNKVPNFYYACVRLSIYLSDFTATNVTFKSLH